MMTIIYVLTARTLGEETVDEAHDNLAQAVARFKEVSGNYDSSALLMAIDIDTSVIKNWSIASIYNRGTLPALWMTEIATWDGVATRWYDYDLHYDNLLDIKVVYTNQSRADQLKTVKASEVAESFPRLGELVTHPDFIRLEWIEGHREVLITYRGTDDSPEVRQIEVDENHYDTEFEVMFW